MANKNLALQAITSPRKRVLGTIRFEENQVLSMKLPLDTTLLGLEIRLTGAVQTTFGSGTPVAKAESTMDSLIPRIDVVMNGSDTVKSVRPHLLHIQSLLATGVQSERFSSAGAAAVAFPTTEGGFVFGTTTQYTSVRETVYLPFEHVYCEPGMGREMTYLQLKGQNSAELKFFTGAFLNLLGFGNTAPVTFGNNTLQLEISTVERQDIPMNVVFDIWKQTMKSQQISSESFQLPVEIPNGNFLTGILLFAQDGAAGTATTATGKLASNALLTAVELKMNGQQSIQRSAFGTLQQQNRRDYGIVAPFAAGVSRLDGIAHMNMLSRRDLTSALPKMRPFTDNLQLFFDSAAASVVSYTNPANVTILTEELIKMS